MDEKRESPPTAVFPRIAKTKPIPLKANNSISDCWLGEGLKCEPSYSRFEPSGVRKSIKCKKWLLFQAALHMNVHKRIVNIILILFVFPYIM